VILRQKQVKTINFEILFIPMAKNLHTDQDDIRMVYPEGEKNEVYEDDA
jgi:hypothetical protein